VSFIITLYVREGIVMASDSRMTLNTTHNQGPNQIVQMAVGQSDTNYKTFRALDRFGISTYGAADIKGVPIAGFIQTFIREVDEGSEVDEVPPLLLEHFKALPSPPATWFHVAGYKGEEQHLWLVDVAADKTERLNPTDLQGASWGGESDTLSRLIQPVGELDENGNLKQALPYHQIPWGFFTLQDAIDFVRYAVQATIDSIRFKPRAKTVGGPVDILVVRPNEATWIQRKELHA
jgi:hypothetical protein